MELMSELRQTVTTAYILDRIHAIRTLISGPDDNIVIQASKDRGGIIRAFELHCQTNHEDIDGGRYSSCTSCR